MEWNGSWTAVEIFPESATRKGILEIPKTEDRRIALELIAEWVQGEGINTRQSSARIYSYHNLLPLLKNIPDKYKGIKFMKMTGYDNVWFNYY